MTKFLSIFFILITLCFNSYSVYAEGTEYSIGLGVGKTIDGGQYTVETHSSEIEYDTPEDNIFLLSMGMIFNKNHELSLDIEKRNLKVTDGDYATEDANSLMPLLKYNYHYPIYGDMDIYFGISGGYEFLSGGGADVVNGMVLGTQIGARYTMDRLYFKVESGVRGRTEKYRVPAAHGEDSIDLSYSEEIDILVSVGYTF